MWLFMILAMWRGWLGFTQYIPLKTAKSGAKSFELFESTAGYLWDFVEYTGPEVILIATYIYVPSSLRSSKTVVKCMEPR
jgi:hypothetical protein